MRLSYKLTEHIHSFTILLPMTAVPDYRAGLFASPSIQSNSLLEDWCSLSPEARASVNESAFVLSKPFSITPLYDRLKSDHSFALSLLSKTGVHPFENHQAKNPFTQKILNDDFSNIGRHSIAVAGCLDILTAELVDAGKISQEQRKLITAGGILHDATKPIGIYGRIAIKEGVFDRSHFESNRGPLIDGWLSSLGMTDDERASLVEANEATGIENLVRDYARVDNDGTLSLVTPDWTRALIRLVDDCVSSVSSPVETHRLLPSLNRCDLADPTHGKYLTFWNGAIVYNKGERTCHILDIPQIGNPPGRTHLAKPITNVFQLEVNSVELVAEEVRHVLSPREPIARGTRWLCSYLEQKIQALGLGK
jgi:hypothetical protein